MRPFFFEILSVSTLQQIRTELVGYIRDLTTEFLIEVQSVGKGLEGGQDHLEMVELIRVHTELLVQLNAVIEDKEG